MPVIQAYHGTSGCEHYTRFRALRNSEEEHRLSARLSAPLLGPLGHSIASIQLQKHSSLDYVGKHHSANQRAHGH